MLLEVILRGRQINKTPTMLGKKCSEKIGPKQPVYGELKRLQADRTEYVCWWPVLCKHCGNSEPLGNSAAYKVIP